LICSKAGGVPPTPTFTLESVTNFRNKCKKLNDKIQSEMSAGKFPELLHLANTKKGKLDNNSVKDLIDLIQNTAIDLDKFVNKFGSIDPSDPSVDIDSVCEDENLNSLVKSVDVLIEGLKQLEYVFGNAFKDIVKDDIVDYWKENVGATVVEKLFGYAKAMTPEQIFEELCRMVDYCSNNGAGGKVLSEIVEGKILPPLPKGVPVPPAPLAPLGVKNDMYEFISCFFDGEYPTFDTINNKLLKGKLGIELVNKVDDYKYEINVVNEKDGLGHMLKNLKIFDYKDIDDDADKKDKKLEDLFTNLYRIKGLKPNTP
jgi:hypothetical protein